MAQSDKFYKRLLWCQRHSAMTVSDLARWFDRPRATVNTWLNGRVPFGPQGPLAQKRLLLLQLSIRSRKARYPIPANLTWKQREEYVRGMLYDAQHDYFIPETRAAR